MEQDAQVGSAAVPLRAAGLCIAILLPLAVFGWVLHDRDVATARSVIDGQSVAIVDLQAQTIVREAGLVESDLLYLLSQTTLADFLAGRLGSRERLENDYVAFARLKGLYDQVRFLDIDGQEMVRVNYRDGVPRVVPVTDLQNKSERDYFRATIGIPRGAIFASPLDLNVEHGQIEPVLKPMIRFASPAFDAKGTRRGIVVLNYLGERLLTTLDEVSSGYPGRLLLVNADGFYLRGPGREDEWGFALGHDRSFPRDFPEAWAEIRENGRGRLTLAGELFTYRELGLGPRPAEPMTIIAHVPRAVLMTGPARRLRRMALALLAVVPLVALLSWYAAGAAHQRQLQKRQIEASEARLRELSAKLLDAHEQERAAVARDLHDDLGQLVTSVVLDLEQTRHADADDAKQERLIERALAGARLMVERVQEIATRVRPRMLDDLGLEDAVRSHLGEFEERTGIDCRPAIALGNVVLPRRISEHVYRIVQEALTNVARHAGASRVDLTLRATPDMVSVAVGDDGSGFDPGSARAGLGLLGMRERAELLGGTFAIDSAPGRGSTVRADIPLVDPHGDA